VKTLLQVILFLVSQPLCGYTQGTFILDNSSALTRLGTIDGPFAGPGIWAQALAGFTADSLTPVGIPVQHAASGFVGREIIIAWAPISSTVLVRMAAWDGTLWGTSFAGVPAGQLGYTDTVPVFLTSPTASPLSTQFTQPAVVPVPEPSMFALAGLGGLVLLLFGRRSHA